MSNMLVMMIMMVVVVVMMYSVETQFTIPQFKVFFHLTFSHVVLKSVISVLNFLWLRFFSSL
jgi:hypothetical protein